MALCTAVLAGCASTNAYYDAAKPHHTLQGFKNNYIPAINKPLTDLLRWQYERRRDALPPAPAQLTPTVTANLAQISANAHPAKMQPAVTWIGHGSVLVQASGLNVLTDPVFSERAAPVQFAGPKRAHPPGLTLDQLPPIDAVLISHSHYDHLDKNSVLALNQRAQGATLFIVPLGLKPWFASLGIANVKEMDWWESTVISRSGSGDSVESVEFHLTPVQHWSARSLGDRNETLWGGWAVLGRDFHWYYGGDAGYSRDFADTRARFAGRQTPALGGGFDLALLPVGGYEPRWFMKEQHINPAEAVQAHQDLGAKRSVGVHWGTFNLTDEPLDQPPRDLAAARAEKGLADADFAMMAVGETRRFAPRALALPRPAPGSVNPATRSGNSSSPMPISMPSLALLPASKSPS